MTKEIMQQILDLHIHSRYSRACSPALTLPNIDAACRTKGVDIIATGDFTYPQWFLDINNQLEEIGESGLYRLKTAKDDKVKFVLSTELALVYKDPSASSPRPDFGELGRVELGTKAGQAGGKARRIHLVVLAPNIEAVEKLNNELGKKYNIKSDGRPILGMKAPELVKLCLSIHPKFLIFPAHIWTPWFSVFGSKSGFDCLEECFHKETKNIFAYETGLSSDPEMNWRLSDLDKLTLLSNSDAHSLTNIAREANVFDLKEISYDGLYEAIRYGKKNKALYSIEFYPEEGMYHFDGHRVCKMALSPADTKKHKGICPVCKKPLTIGVLNRVEELADRKEGYVPKNKPGFKKLVELDKIIAEALGVKSRSSEKVKKEYDRLIEKLGSELHILLNVPIEEIAGVGRDAINCVSTAVIAEGIRRVREGRLIIEPGYDGEYGKIRIFSDEERTKNKQQKFF